MDDEAREVVGVDEDEIFALEERISNVIHDSIEPLISPQVTTQRVGDRLALVVTVFPGNLKPYYLKSKGPERGVFVHIGSSNRQADRPTIQELWRQRLNISFDATPHYDVSPEVINREYVQQYVEIRRQVRDIPSSPVDDHLLERLRILVREGGQLYPSVGGLLLFSERIGEYFPHARIKCARFVGSQVGEYLDQKEIALPLPRQIEAAIKFFKANVRRGAKIQNLYRQEQYEYPDVAVREALVNAVCRRDYNIGGSDIKFAVFEDRLEVTSPGALPLGITLEELGTGVSEIRNRVVARIFRDMGLIEEWGWGIARIREAMQLRGLRPPEFRETGNFFKVTLYNRPAVVSTSSPALDEDEEKLIRLARERGRIRTRDAVPVIGKSDRTVQKKLKALTIRGMLEWHGSSPTDPRSFFTPVRAWG